MHSQILFVASSPRRDRRLHGRKAPGKGRKNLVVDQITQRESRRPRSWRPRRNRLASGVEETRTAERLNMRHSKILARNHARWKPVESKLRASMGGRRPGSIMNGKKRVSAGTRCEDPRTPTCGPMRSFARHCFRRQCRIAEESAFPLQERLGLKRRRQPFKVADLFRIVWAVELVEVFAGHIYLPCKIRGRSESLSDCCVAKQSFW
jgi:hypothetical protein